MIRTYNFNIETKDFYKNINNLIQSENSDIKWIPDKKYSGFFANGKFRLSESVGLNPFYFNRINQTVIYGNYKLDNETITIDATFKLRYRIRILLIFYSLAIFFFLIAIFNHETVVTIITLLFLALITLADKIITRIKTGEGAIRFQENIIEKIKKSTANSGAL